MSNRTCPHCGEPLGNPIDARCPHCRRSLEGSSTRRPSITALPPRDSYRDDPARTSHAELLDARLRDFATRLWRITPRAPMTPILIGINIAVFIVMVIADVSITDPTAY